MILKSPVATVDPKAVQEALLKPTSTSLTAADAAIDLTLTKVLEACQNKEIAKKIMPFATQYTMDVLEGVFGQKQMKTDTRIDDSYISVYGEPTAPLIDNVASRLQTITDRSALVLHSEMTRSSLPPKLSRRLTSKRKALSKLSSTKSAKSSRKSSRKNSDDEKEKETSIADSG